MSYLSAQPGRSTRARVVLGAVVFAVGFIVVTSLDKWLWAALLTDKPIESRDWYRMLRIAGYLPTWVIAGTVVAIVGRHARGIGPGIALAGSAAMAGLAAEILKLVIARERPGETGEYVYRGIFAGFADGSNLGMPSSHAAVAFGAAIAAGRLMPGTGWVLFPIACGCGLTRLLMGDHFTSDVYVAAWLGLVSAVVCVPRRDRRRERGGTARLSA
ncbi:MAG: hypothetical protein AMXMBFR58_27930 [Phycisphaerae bacterium]|nr:hypothetical protein [Phycisphaerales bacterium]